ncbi:hypothetical protein MHC_02040 [Mycoplasma haemocanis str. Illinois]|uniref:Uncharacterized protein n=1 Tax=Mycoplasma haemocanis (strain Illinois) TaxID=1111676 RepID=H6N6K2_MYCHN|nr:hypothetical protein [Mycoplasma haemocanis]AEW45274.1 hypothetical protein MHC_02040 [Mycoplasma haemocanis str. Illinois]
MVSSTKIALGVIGFTGVSGATYFGIREFLKEDLTPHLVRSKLGKGVLNTKGDDSLWSSRDTELNNHSDPVDPDLKSIKTTSSASGERKNQLIKWCEQKYKEDSRTLRNGVFEEVQKFCTRKISEQIQGRTEITGEVSTSGTKWNASWSSLKGDSLNENTLFGDFKIARTTHKAKGSGTEGETALKAACEKYKKFPYLNENDMLFKNVSSYCYSDS